MNENINLTKILKDCPKGTEFYHAGYGRVWFASIDLHSHNPIKLSTKGDCIVDVSVTEKGTLNIFHEGECLLFPSKYQRDWSKFTAPWYNKKLNPKNLKSLDRVLVKNNGVWFPTFFEFYREEDKICVCRSGYYDYCIPYNYDTKHLVGTTEEAPEYYKYWE